jgi:serine-threonine kinase receptor-associated protein
MGEPVNSMEMVHGGGTLSVTSGKTVHFLDIMGYVSAGLSD